MPDHSICRFREPTHQEVAAKAFQIYMERGGGISTDLQEVTDWDEAECQLRFVYRNCEAPKNESAT